MKAGLKRWIGRFPDVGDVVKRFPVAVFAMAVFTLIIIFRDLFLSEPQMGRLLLGLVIGGYLCVSIVLASESRGKLPSLILQLAVVIIVAGLAWFSESLRLNLPMAVGAAILLLGNAVIWRQKRDDLHVWDFTHKLWTGAAFATLGSIIFTLGLLAITAALKSLFGIKMNWLMEDLLLPVGLGFLAPLYWMATLPPVDEDYSELYGTPGFVSKAVAFLGTWLLSPLTLIYALILLAYGVKIVIAGELPKGEIAALTTPFLIAGTLTWIVLDPPFARDRALANLFRKLWWPVSIPAVLLLAVAVYVRISEYGYTPERFALTLLIIWALGIALWFIFAPKVKRDIRFIPGVAAVLLALGTVSAGWISYINQGQRFEAGLIDSGVMAADGSIEETPVITDEDAAKRAKGAFQYLMLNEGKDRVAKVLEGTSIEFDKEDSDNQNILKALGLHKIESYDRWGDENSTRYERGNEAISLADFDTLRGPFSLYEMTSEQELFKDNNFSATADDGLLTFDIGGETVIFKPGKWIDEQSLGYGDVDVETPIIMVSESETYSLSLVVNRFSRWTRDSDVSGASGFNMEFYVLTRGLD